MNLTRSQASHMPSELAEAIARRIKEVERSHGHLEQKEIRNCVLTVLKERKIVTEFRVEGDASTEPHVTCCRLVSPPEQLYPKEAA